MRSSAPDQKSKHDQLRDFRHQSFVQRGERFKLIAMFGGLALVIGLFFYIRSRTPSLDEGLMPVDDSMRQTLGTQIQMPPIDLEMFVEVHDASSADRLVIEPGPFSTLLEQSRALLPGHLLTLGEPGFPFAEADPRPLRGKPFRLRGEVKDLRTFKRVHDGPEETWLWVQTDQGDDYFFASKGRPATLFDSGGNFVLTDGYFFKYYTQTLEEERITAPVFVGRGLRPSAKRLEPVQAIDAVLLSDVEDSEFGDDGKFYEGDGFWHLMSWVQTLGKDPEQMQAAFDGAEAFNKNMLADFAADPSLFRGKAVRIVGRPVRAITEAAGENPLRAGYLSYSFLHKYEFDDQYILVAAPGDRVFDKVNLSRELLGYFLRLWSYIDGDGNQRKVPLFVIAGSQQKFTPTSILESQITLIFLGSFVVLAFLIFLLVRRDRAQAAEALAKLQERRRQHRQQSAGRA